MTTNIKCPKCHHEFALGEAEAEEYKKELQGKMSAFVKQKDSEYSKKVEELEKMRPQLEATAYKKATDEMFVKMKSLEDDAKNKAQQLQELQKKELELLRERKDLEERSRNFDVEIEKRLLEDRKKVEDDTIQREKHLFDLKMKDKDLQLEGLKKTIEELRQKSEQGSMQTQGESQELLLEELLKNSFPFDIITEVGKGVRGADCIQTIRNNFGHECGKIIFESKRTKDFSNEWIEKIKADRRNLSADLAVIVTQTLPKDMSSFGEKDSVWICTFNEVKAVVYMLRDSIIKVSGALKSQENKGEKMSMLYEFLTGNEFRGQIEAIVEGFVAMKQSINRERIQMEKNWKEREKQIDKVLINTSGMYGSIKGIAGSSINNIPLLEGDDNNPNEDD